MSEGRSFSEGSDKVRVTTRSDRAPGIRRLPRRPAGWTAPGPPPAGPGQRPDLHPGPGEDLSYLCGDWRIFQRIDGHRWSMDDLVTAWYALRSVRHRPVARTLDLGCGIGSVLLMTAWGLPQAAVLGLEAQELSVGLARRSIDYNGVTDRCHVRQADFRDAGSIDPEGSYDLITGTPPYFDEGEGRVSNQPQRGPCRFEVRGGVEDYCRVAAMVLAPEGRFVFCLNSNQYERALVACRQTGLQMIEAREVIPREGKPPLITLFNAKKGGSHPITPPLATEPLTIRDAECRKTHEFNRLRRDMGLPPHPEK